MTPSPLSSSLLLRYFEIAERRLQFLTDYISEADTNLSWHRSRIVEAQLTSLDDAISEWQRQNDVGEWPINRDTVQSVLRQIGLGDFSCVSYDGNNGDFTLPSTSSTGLRSRSSRGSLDDGHQQSEQGVLKDDGQEQQVLLTEAVEKTNELARQAFARSVLISEWRLDRQQLSQSGRELRGNHGNDCIDEKSTMEYCGLMMAAVRLPEVQQYLLNGTMEFTHSNHKAGNHSEDLCDNSVEDRLFRIQKLYWRALGWEPIHAIDQLKCLLAGENTEYSNFEQTIRNAKGMETLTKYASAMTVAATNADMSHIGDGINQSNDDGTTRIVSVSYSEKIILPTDSGNTTSHSLSAPTSNTIDEHKLSQQRQELDVAHKASMLQQQLWSEFESLPPHEQSKTLEKAKKTQSEFLEKVANTPPGRDRVVLMQSMDGEMQKLLVIYKLWCCHNSDAE
eukprot:CAMPEP_0201870330 /NCGR_PEP_ID=MMETSP0902-20130614/3464_1 /ASSEMBLY_ACC=CAM_ASM_000551 /TAXON_ID=420261 /ORGANISM="Thalassiosira antarctica, Strain CCMP982" /LENGTH=449 /DNA_ID=CAMNT_0048395921 /DNA_START=13 /DNA_END=1362 /DNA_ORIENTATION=+